VKETKTEVIREIPVHPVLAQLLAQWKLSGWKKLMERELKGDDLIIPTLRGEHRKVNSALKAFHRDLETLGLRKRRHYDSRRTFISMALDGGASKDVLRYITHPSPTDAFDLYKTPSWEARCAQVLCLKVSTSRGKVLSLHREEGSAVGASP
jgi:integrase